MNKTISCGCLKRIDCASITCYLFTQITMTKHIWSHLMTKYIQIYAWVYLVSYTLAKLNESNTIWLTLCHRPQILLDRIHLVFLWHP